jgi:hypothetical protein
MPARNNIFDFAFTRPARRFSPVHLRLAPAIAI